MTAKRNLFDGLRPARPPADLRERTLDAARAALQREPVRPDVWTRLVASRTARVLWAAAVLVLSLAHLVASLPRSVAPPSIDLTPILARDTEPEVLELVRMAPIDPSAARARGLGPAPTDKENGS